MTTDQHQSSETPDAQQAAEIPSSPETEQGPELQQENIQAEKQEEVMDDPSKLSKANKEAARYRTQLKETRAELDQVTLQRENLLRHAIESNLPEYLAPELFWKLSESPSEFLTDEGLINSEALNEKIETITSDYRLARSDYPVVNAAGRMPDKSKPRTSLADAFHAKK